jgi:hypothetical protein
MIYFLAVRLIYFFPGILLTIAMPFKVINVSEEKVVYGRQESGGGIHYHITIVVEKSSRQLHFENILAGDSVLELKLTNTNKKLVHKFSVGDTLTINSTINLSPIDMQNDIFKNTSSGIGLKYSFKGKTDTLFLHPGIANEKFYP